jgi:rSAM/selenodomain-associated transferase 1
LLLKNCLLIFAKYPEPGWVKTRLAKKIGPEKAASFYKEMVETVIQKTAPENGEYRRVLYFDPPERKNDFQKWLPHLNLKPQACGDLGERMAAAIGDSFKIGVQKVVVVGSDCVDIDRNLVCEALSRLDRSDLVVGPAADGGYYLLGMKKLYDLFTGIPWSTDQVLPETLKKTARLNLTITLLPTLVDIDEIP